MNQKSISAVVVAAMSFSLLGATPSTQPVVSPGESQAEVSLPIDNSDASLDATAALPAETKPRHGDRASRLAQRFSPPSAKETADALQYMQTHSPERYKAITALPDGDSKTNLINLAARAYQNWMRLASTDSELYAVVQKRIELEDQIFGKVAASHKDPADPRSAVQSDLKDLVGKLVDNGIEERKLRLQRLEAIIKKEQKTLESDTANRSGVVDARLKAILSSDAGALIPGSGVGAGTGGTHSHSAHP